MLKQPESSAEVNSILEKYVHGCVSANGSLIREVFHPEAQLFGKFEGKTVTFAIEAWIDRLTGNPKPANDAKISEPPEDGIEWTIDHLVFDENIAHATVVSRFLNVWYRDHMTLLQTEDGWKIVNKTFTYEKI